MFEDEARVLIILPQHLVDRARTLAGRTTTTLRLAVSLQIVLRALIDEGLKRPGDEALLGNIGRQAVAVRRIRTEARRAPAASGARRGPPAAARRKSS